MASCHYCSCRHPSHYEYPPFDLRPEPWSRRRIVTTWAVTGMFLVALAIGMPLLRNANERSWCSGGEGTPASEQCLEDQKAIRCGPLDVLHCPSD